MTLIGGAALLLSLAPALQQTQPNQPAKATIEGFVVRVGTNEPIGRARITIVRRAGAAGAPIQPNATTSIPPVTTDSQGRFIIKDLDPGTYSLVAQRNGFARQSYGERAPGRAETPLNITAGQSLKDVIFRLTPAGTVTGTVSDAKGEPLAGLTVQLLRATYDFNGGRHFQPQGSAKTDDRGEYRIYWVTPGRYYVVASAPWNAVDSFPIQPSTNEVLEPGYTPTYYPGATDPSQAASVEILPGTELSAIDFTINQQQLFRIRGRLIDARTGQFPRNAQILMAPRNPQVGVEPLLGNYNNTNGSFEIRHVAAGQYRVQAIGSLTTGNPDPASRFSGQLEVDVSNADIENLVVVSNKGFTIIGHLSVEGGQPIASLPNSDTLRVFLRPIVSTGGLVTASPQLVSLDGSFKIETVQPDDYRITASPLPPGMYVKEARLGAVDVLNGLSITESISDRLEVLLSPKAAQIHGRIVDKDGNTVGGVQAILIPERQRDRRDLYRTATSDQNGEFLMRTVVPGDYKLFAWEDIEPFEYNDPDFLRKYEELGTPVKLAESSTASVEAKLIPAGQ